MAWIEAVDEAAAQGRLARLFGEIAQRRGKVANIMRIHSLMPETMKAHADLYLSVVFSASGLSREERELLAVVVSAANRCDYCVEHHAEALNHYWQDPDRLEKLKADYRTAGLSKRSSAIAIYGNKLTRKPAGMSEQDIADLREAGLSDVEVLHVNLVVSYFNFVNRIALGLGVESSPEEISGYKYQRPIPPAPGRAGPRHRP
jgi:uncharacterized peroxidase-related enzyme